MCAVCILSCVWHASIVPLGEPQPSAALRATEAALLDGRIRHAPRRLQWLQPINPDNVAEVFATALSALALQAEHPADAFDVAWNHRQRWPIPKHAASLVRHVCRHTWRGGEALGPSERNGSTIVCYREPARIAVPTYAFASRVLASATAARSLRAMLVGGRLARSAASRREAEERRPLVALLLQRPVGRSVLNEAAALAALRSAGFASARAIVPEGLKLMELARLVGEASLLFGIHGAALAHLVWLPPGRAALIEAFLPDHAYALFPLLCRAANVLRR